MPKITITIKAHDWSVPATPIAMFTVCKGTFPKRESIAYCVTREDAELVARALVKHYVTAEVVRIDGPPEPEKFGS